MNHSLTPAARTDNGGPEPFGVRLTGVLLVLGTFLLPLKFGSLAVMPDASGFLDVSWAAWSIISWPAHTFGIFSGLLLLAALFGCGLPHRRGWGTVSALLWTAGLPLAALLGGRGTPDFVFGAVSHFFAVGAFAGGAALLFSRAPRWWRPAVIALAAGVLLTCLCGTYQYFIGMAATRAYVAQQQAEGVRINPVILARLADNRVYGPMVSCNALAGFLLLGAPVAVLCAVRAGDHFEPKRLSRIVLGTGVFLLTIGVLALTRSRGAFVCAAVAGTGWLLDRKLSLAVRWWIAGMLLLLLGAGAFYVHQSERGFLSTGERADYLRTSLYMVRHHPLGAGWGAFYHTHQRIKRSGSDESARDPHDLIASFSAQCGIPGGLLAAAALLVPLAGMWKLRRRGRWYKAGFWSCTALTLHLLMDIGIHIPATLAALILVELAVLLPNDQEAPHPASGTWRNVRMAALLLIGIAAAGANGWWLAGEYAFGNLSALVQPQDGEMIRYSRNHPEAVLAAYGECLRFRPWSAYPPWLAGDYFWEAGELSAARGFYDAALARDPDQAALHWRLALLAAKEGDTGSAQFHRRKAHTLFPAHPLYRIKP